MPSTWVFCGRCIEVHLSFNVVPEEGSCAICLGKNHLRVSRDINEDREQKGADGQPDQWVVNGTCLHDEPPRKTEYRDEIVTKLKPVVQSGCVRRLGVVGQLWGDNL